MIETTLGPKEESALIKHEGLVDTDNETTKAVEYCVIGCTGQAHSSGIADSETYFCSQHVHRSVHVVLKRVEGLQSALGSFR